MAEIATKRPGRNEPCHCGSGKKYKHCHLFEDEEADRLAREKAAAAAAPPPEPAEDEPAPHAAPPPRTHDQPSRRAARSTRGPKRITTPRKAG